MHSIQTIYYKSFSIVSLLVYYSLLNSMEVPCNKNIILLWDIHEVLAQPDDTSKAAFAQKYFTILGLGDFKEQQQKASLDGVSLSKFVLNTIRSQEELLFTQHPELKKAFDAIAKGMPSEAYAHVLREYGYDALANFVDTLSLSYKPMPGMEEIVLSLAKHGIKQRIASNIGKKIFVALKDRFEKEYRSTLLNVMELAKITNISPHTTDNDTKLYAHYPKSNPQFYDEYLADYDPDKNEYTIFVDNAAKNTNAAQKNDRMNVILFKSPEQLKNQFIAMGILNPQSKI